MQNRVAVTDPVYPVYIDTNVMGGRAGNIAKDGQHWDNIIYIPCTSENNFIPEPPSVRPDIIPIIQQEPRCQKTNWKNG